MYLDKLLYFAKMQAQFEKYILPLNAIVFIKILL